MAPARQLGGLISLTALFTIAWTLGGGRASADMVYERLKSFGFADQLGHNPGAGLVPGSQGEFYGTTTAGGVIGGGGGVVYRFAPHTSNYTIVRAFGSGATDPRTPGPLIMGSDGMLYGTTQAGGAEQKGTVFKMNTDGSGYTELLVFGTNAAGSSPQGRLLQATGGRLYGATYSGGQANRGAIFGLDPDGSNYQVLHHFAGGNEDGSYPKTGLVQGADGALYGVTEYGAGTNRMDYGTVFRINKDGSAYQVLHKFGRADGAYPRGELARGETGTLIGTTRSGGTNSAGVLFKLVEGLQGVTILHEFGGWPGDGKFPAGALMPGTNGMLYGTTASGGTNNAGVMFAISPDGSDYSVLTHFPTSVQGNTSFVSELAMDPNGVFYATRTGGDAEGLGLIFKIQNDGAGFAVLKKFSQYGGDARGGGGSLIRASDGWLYGASSSGGWNNAGAIFRFQEGGLDYQLVRSFSTNEAASSISLAEALPGVLFGAADRGGANNMGTIFRLATDGSDFRVLHEFAGGAADGERPSGRVALGRDGSLYGTTFSGGQGFFGTIYRISPDGTEFAVIYSFVSGQILWPACTLVQGSDDMLYGTANSGGISGGPVYGRGGVFKISTNGAGFEVLYDFANDTSGGCGYSQSGVVIGLDQALYGVSASGDTGLGAVFRITQDGSQFSVLHLFANADGWSPRGTLCLGQDGMFYGATQFGGTYGGAGGAVFRGGPDGSGFSLLHSFPFPIGPQGGRPTGGLVQGQDGWLYGLTPLGGEFSSGVIFRVHPTHLTNHPPNLAASLPDQSIYAKQPYDYTVPEGTFYELDWQQTVSYSASNLPPNVTFDPVSRRFQGTPPAGAYDITVVGTDNGLPAPQSGADTYRLSVVLPDVAIEVQPPEVIVNWPTGLHLYYDLEESSSLSPDAVWTWIGMPSGYQIGSRRYTTLPFREGQWFYRLRSR